MKSFNDEYVIELSQELDTYILQFQKKNYLQFHRNSKMENPD
ncbi:aspartyl-phosphate phosphatase Spo0E family protein [Paenibacillus apiarius]|uniref:Aspartyl-phosphate phosphatase Spo0E family protein n=1 Tax=Paenibacillus apiarius TaxID=46240 RepID=A0ABT4DRN4_9BACL|nr:aspartyl-phosphate phosphatase Spo0E family protein [Paenibacillus apiarius]MCY9520015.1 aspartyl-phosphate phosphatase Spo0E family protein [Paenibacillus apiarius]MCY9554362.1 aspartyl-phosphate phosphatase Spo0E family protein [Paenibacillus apiarius]MCY9558153.1 aspartyl-phosphate phosphatase Spo0E family protein [Paenibacillus apiarius]MCY9684948.1 aspartyl-phosphate phosphatase Spo0E family protein [Paenibacillus apiarius]